VDQQERVEVMELQVQVVQQEQVEVMELQV